MPAFPSFSALGRLIMRTPPPPVDVLEAYAHDVLPMVDRAELLYLYWLEQSTLFSDSERLGNVAAIHRWETAKMSRSLEDVKPPAVLADAHADMVDALGMTSRAAQLLSSGSRFHNASAVCEGQALLTVSRERRLAALKAMWRYLEAVVAPAVPEDQAAQAATLAEAAALASLSEGQAERIAPGRAPASPNAGSATMLADPSGDGQDDDQGDDDLGDGQQDEDDAALPSFLAAAAQDATDRAAGAAPESTAGSPEGGSTEGGSPQPPAPGAAERPGWGALFEAPGDPGEPPRR
jgi:hypothetical protein